MKNTLKAAPRNAAKTEAPAIAAGKKPKSLVITVSGETAQKLRDSAKSLGMKPETIGATMVASGLWVSDPACKNEVLAVLNGQGLKPTAKVTMPAMTPVGLPSGYLKRLQEINDIIQYPGGVQGILCELIEMVTHPIFPDEVAAFLVDSLELPPAARGKMDCRLTKLGTGWEKEASSHSSADKGGPEA